MDELGIINFLDFIPGKVIAGQNGQKRCNQDGDADPCNKAAA
jgi:hypothetical protein